MNSILDTMATTALEREHGTIQQVLASMSKAADALDRGRTVETDVLKQFLDFFRIFVEGAHNTKEELILFMALEKKGVPSSGCPLDLPRNEHMQGQALIADLADSISSYLAGESGGNGVVARSLRRLAAFYALHIWNEDHLLFPIANKFLSPDDQDAICAQFARVDSKNGADFQVRFRSIAKELVRTMNA
jgi:uncharacterized protein